ncbi:MAG: two pore domain potassium channel family protein [Gammaproteobacteria bacterium]|nr:two pore domain potassium channel family protein [Gammaproteobacteria bacterium]
MVKRSSIAPKRTAGRRSVRLRVSHTPKLGRYLQSLYSETYISQVILLLVALWLLFSAGLLLAERAAAGMSITTYGEALYWGIAALSTAGIADTPESGLGQAIGGAWILVGSVIFFGTIVASVTGYFMRPIQRPARQIVETIEYNLEHLEDLSVEELALLKKTTDGLIVHMERLKSSDASTRASS